jgi:hypothetical protein
MAKRLFDTSKPTPELVPTIDDVTGRFAGWKDRSGNDTLVPVFAADGTKRLVAPDGTLLDVNAYKNGRGVWHLPGSQGAYSQSAATAVTYYFKLELEAPFSGVRLVMQSREINKQSANWEFLVAPTEEPLNVAANGKTASQNALQPIIGGTVYNNLAATGAGTQHGWTRGTWGGQNASPALPAGSAVLSVPNAVSNWSVSGNIVSDRAQVRSIAPTSGSRPQLLMRIRKPLTTGESFSWFIGPNTNLPAWYAAKTAGESFFRGLYAQEYDNQDGINTLTTMPAPYDETASGAQGMPYFSLIVDYDVPVRSFCAVGDSVTENGGYQQYYLDSWSARAVLAKSSPSAPISYYNCGMSSQNSETYFAQFANLVASGMVFTDVMFPNFSINDFSPVYVFNQYDTQRYKQRLLKAMDICRAMGARVYIWTTYYDTAPSMAGQTTALAALAEMNTWTRNLCASGAATLVDINAIWSVGTMLGGDGIHPSLVGIKASAPVLGAVL